jgi:hypothetical protein
MRYPSLNSTRTDMIVEQLRNGETVSVDAVATWRGEGESIDFDELDILLEEIQTDFDRRRAKSEKLDKDRDRFEGELSVKIFPFLSLIPIPVLDDPGFWRYLSVSRFWWFISWREAEPVNKGNAATYTSSQRNTEQIPLRLYLRAKSLYGTDEMTLAHSLKKSTDFWRSHIIRVQTGTAPNITKAFAELQADDDTRMKTDILRAYARKLNRTWTNVNLMLLDEVEAKSLIKELKE